MKFMGKMALFLVCTLILACMPIQHTKAANNNLYALSVWQSYAPGGTAGSGNFKPGTKVCIKAGTKPGATFVKWVFSDGRTFSNPTMTFDMPTYNLNVTAKWSNSSLLYLGENVSTTNLKGTQLTDWNAIAAKLDTLTQKDLVDTAVSNTLETLVIGSQCIIDKNTIDHLDKRVGTALLVRYLTDTYFTFYSDVDNSKYVASDFSYTTTQTKEKEKALHFNTPGELGTNIVITTTLPNSTPGKVANVYLNVGNKPVLYTPVTIDAANQISFLTAAKVDFIITY